MRLVLALCITFILTTVESRPSAQSTDVQTDSKLNWISSTSETDGSEPIENSIYTVENNQVGQNQNTNISKNVLSKPSLSDSNTDELNLGASELSSQDSLKLLADSSSQIIASNKIGSGSDQTSPSNSNVEADMTDSKSSLASPSDVTGHETPSFLMTSVGDSGEYLEANITPHVLCADDSNNNRVKTNTRLSCPNTVLTPPAPPVTNPILKKKKKPKKVNPFPDICPQGTYAACCLGQPVFTPLWRRTQGYTANQDVHGCRVCEVLRHSNARLK